VLEKQRGADGVNAAGGRDPLEQLSVGRERAVLALTRSPRYAEVFSRKVTRFERPTKEMPAAHSSGWNASPASTM